MQNSIHHVSNPPKFIGNWQTVRIEHRQTGERWIGQFRSKWVYWESDGKYWKARHTGGFVVSVG